jgi:hypothetical protein
MSSNQPDGLTTPDCGVEFSAAFAAIHPRCLLPVRNAFEVDFSALILINASL